MNHRREIMAAVVCGVLAVTFGFGVIWAVSEVVGIAWADFD